MFGYVYITTNKINGKRYVGLHRSTYFNPNYMGSGKLILRALKKYGKKNFKVEILEKCKSENELIEREIYWIKEMNSINDVNFYNLHEGGSGGPIAASFRVNHKFDHLAEDWCQDLSKESHMKNGNRYRNSDKEFRKEVLNKSINTNKRNGTAFFDSSIQRIGSIAAKEANIKTRFLMSPSGELLVTRQDSYIPSESLRRRAVCKIYNKPLTKGKHKGWSVVDPTLFLGG